MLNTAVNEALDAAQMFLTDSDAILASSPLPMMAYLAAAWSSSRPDSDAAKVVAKIKPGSTPLLAGLPAHKYFFFGGSSIEDPKAFAPVVNDILDPVIKNLREVDSIPARRSPRCWRSPKASPAPPITRPRGW